MRPRNDRHFVLSVAFGRTWIDAYRVASKVMPPASTDDWTEEKCIQLIREYRNRSILWDSKNAFFFKKSMKQSCWEEIGKILGVTADECRYKMNILTSSFRREKAKIMHSILNGDVSESDMYQTAWFAFKEMVFLMDREAERNRQLGIEDDDDNDMTSTKRTLMTLHLKPTTSSSSTGIKKPKASQSVRKHWSKVIAKKIQMECNETQAQTNTPRPQPQTSAGPSQKICDDEIGSFATFIGNKMKKYTEKTKNSVQQAICEIVFKADQGYFENSTCEKFTIIDDDIDPLDRLSHGTIKIENDSDISD